MSRDMVVAIEDELVVWLGTRRAWVERLAATGSEDDWPTVEAHDGYLLPGLVDVHCHGAAGHDFSEADVRSAEVVAAHHRRHGTTSLVASLVTAPVPDLLRALAACADLVDAGEVFGIHLEGPFLSVARCGAHNPALLRMPDEALFDQLLEAGRGHVRSLTYAPELPGASRLAARAVRAGLVASVGHTDGDFATTAEAIRATGMASSVTHLFNAMPPVHHRAPGPAAAALAAAARGETVVELVADGVHLGDETVGAVFDMVGANQVALVTDAMAATGQPDGRYRLGPLEVRVEAGVARLDGRGEQAPIAGGTTRLLDVVRRCVRHAGVDLHDAVTAASATPARLLGLEEVGVIATGRRADLVITDRDLFAIEVLRGGVAVTPA
jgi:N-acetylglucosamine-6-phosphate deacetylase